MRRRKDVKEGEKETGERTEECGSKINHILWLCLQNILTRGLHKYWLCL